MAKAPPTKSKPPPWIPPGKASYRGRKQLKPETENVNITDKSPIRIADMPRNVDEVHKEDDLSDVMSLSSSSSYHGKNESDFHLYSIFQEMKLLYVHFASLKTSYMSAHRLIDSQDIEDININELLCEMGMYIKEINELFDDLEFGVSILENTLDENLKKQEYCKVFKCKEKVLSKLLDMYERVIIVFQTIFEKQDFKEVSQLQDSLNKKLQSAEKKYISQEAVIKDLERKLSIYQSKTNAMESYKTNLEIDKAELQKQLSFKESQIKYLSNELMNVSVKQTKSDHEELIEIIEDIKSKAHAEKSALKKAVKLQKSQLKESEEKLKKQLLESNEKEKMMFDIAAQRDQLKIQLTVLNNTIIQQKSQIEEIRIQNLKLQNEIAEKELSFKKETNSVQGTLEEKLSELDKALKAKKNLEINVEQLEEQIESYKKQVRSLREEMEDMKLTTLPKEKDTDSVREEMRRLISLLKNTKDVFENLKTSTQVVSSVGDQPINDAQLHSAQSEVLSAVKETREHLLELRNLFETFLQEQKGTLSSGKNYNSEKQLRKLEHMYEASVKENQALKAKIEEMKTTSISAVQEPESCLAANMSRDCGQKMQYKLHDESKEILDMKLYFKERQNELESQLKEYKNMVETLETDRLKLSTLEEELKNTKLELSLLQQKKEEEAERLLQRIKELQYSLDTKNAEFSSLENYVKLLKESYRNVFGGS